MTVQLCPHCRKPLADYRAGVLLPPLKVRIFDAVVEAGHAGLTTREIIADVFQEGTRTLAAVRHHITAINDLLRGTGVRIRRKDHRRWVIRAPRQAAMEAASA
jgi:hypothetical protein